MPTASFLSLFTYLIPNTWYLRFTPAQTSLLLFGQFTRQVNRLALNNRSLEWTQMRTKQRLDLRRSQKIHECTHVFVYV